MRHRRAPTQTPSLQSRPFDWVDEASDESFPASDAPAWPASASARTEPVLELLLERSRVPAYPLSTVLTRLYGGDFGLSPRSLVANFVSSVDGVVALGPEYPESGSAISGRNPGDRFVMGLLRASADAVLIGAGTLRATPGHTWTAEAIYPAAAAEFRDLRRRLGRTDQPRLLVVTARGDIDVNHHGLRNGALILTTDAGAERLRGRAGPHVVLRSLGGDAQIRMQAVVDAVRSEGHKVILTEGGPTLIGQLLAADLLDELFLTVSPTLFGRSPAPRQGLVEGVAFGPSEEVRLDLRSVRRQGAYLFLRYACASRMLAMTTKPPQAATGSALEQLVKQGQSVWLDYISRNLLRSGQLQRLIDERHITGLTSNPTIFGKAIGDGTDYDEQLATLIASGTTDPDALYIELTAPDIQRAADVLRPVYDASDGQDGFVSIEVPPSVAHDAAESLAIGRFLWERVDRPNTLVKVPATVEGYAAIEQLVTSGVNVNITLIFAQAAYEAVIEAYLRALAARMRAKLPVAVRSVASFFVSRVDTEVDGRLEKMLEADPDNPEVRSLMGKAAIANARIAYETFERVFASQRFATLHAAGAAVQRPLWASTSAKNPAYRDVLYAEALIAPETIDTMPLATIEAFAEHGIVAGDTAEQAFDQAHETIKRLGAIGIDMDEVTVKLLEDGLRTFAEAYDGAVHVIAPKADAALREGSALPEHDG